jgi:hypothetical protein
VNSEQRTGRTLPATWAGLALAVQTLFILVPGFVWAGRADERVTGLERYRDQHRMESVQRTDFDDLRRNSLHTETFSQFSERVLERLRRIEEKLDRLR